MQLVDTAEAVENGLDELCRMDRRLVAARAIAGPVPLRRTEPGFQSLASIIVSQQVSKASAAAIFDRLNTLANPFSPHTILAAGDDLFRRAGLSRPKQKTLRATAEAVANGKIDLHGLCEVAPGEAIATLTTIHGVGLWTAEVYLMFAAGHPDIFPARDVALQSAVGNALGHNTRPGEKELIAIARSWSPLRSIAARLFWAYYAQMRGTDGAPA